MAEAVGGDHLPTWATVAAFVAACHGDPTEWLPRWEVARDSLDANRSRTPADDAASGHDAVVVSPGESVDVSTDRSRPRRVVPLVLWLGLAGVVVAAAVLVLVALHVGPKHGLRLAAAPLVDGGSTSQPHIAAQPVVVVVQNMVAEGPSGLVEDSTPEYLSTQPVPRCSIRGCEIAGTQMWSGAVLAVTCETAGAMMYNYNLDSAESVHNPNDAGTNLWYKAILPSGVEGYISAAYLEPRYRSGIRLPQCPAE